ncbi:segregation and condensation protein A [Spirochaetota bacterium]
MENTTAPQKDKYKIQIQNFEGPLELLLELIHSQEIDIYDIPIGEITAQYLAYIELMKKIDMDITSEFIVMAATLMHIKSRMLLPIEIDDGYESEFEDPRADLVRQLLEYQKYKQLAEKLEDFEAHAVKIIERNDSQMIFTTDRMDEDLWQEVRLLDLIKVFSGVVHAVDLKKFPAVEEEQFTVEDKIVYIEEQLNRESKINFHALFSGYVTKSEVVVTFWAILEMVKMKKISIMQHTIFGDIYIFTKEAAESGREDI